MKKKTKLTPEPKPKLSAAHNRLQIFVGHWQGEGQNAAGPDSPGLPVVVVDNFAWLAGGFFLQQTDEMRFGENRFMTTSIIGYDAASKSYQLHHFDSLGYARVYDVSVRGQRWTFHGDRERATYVFSRDGKSLQVNWEQTTNGKVWTPLCDFTLAKTPAPAAGKDPDGKFAYRQTHMASERGSRKS